MNEATLPWLNRLTHSDALEAFRRCCGAVAWCEAMCTARPFGDEAAMRAAAGRAFQTMPREAWLEAFACHPPIGDLESLRMRFTGNKQWSAGEQAGVTEAGDAIIRRLAEGNQAYQERFGHLFIVCATGKSADAMLALLEARLGNDAETELRIASDEQRKITHLRLDKLSATEPE